jgi:hypothetical protein
VISLPNNDYTVLYALRRTGGLAYCIKRESLSPHASGGGQTASARFRHSESVGPRHCRGSCHPERLVPPKFLRNKGAGEGSITYSAAGDSTD